jgi:hypothetical protein
MQQLIFFCLCTRSNKWIIKRPVPACIYAKSDKEKVIQTLYSINIFYSLSACDFAMSWWLQY